MAKSFEHNVLYSVVHNMFLSCVTAECHPPSLFPVWSLLQVYNADGEFLFKFGSHGEGNGQFNAPTGVAVDSNGNIIVADWGNSRIQVRKLHLTEDKEQKIIF